MRYSQSFLTLNGYQPLIIFLRHNVVFVSSPRWIFILSSIGFFDALPVEKLFPGLPPKMFWKFGIFPVESSSPHQVTETEYLIDI